MQVIPRVCHDSKLRTLWHYGDRAWCRIRLLIIFFGVGYNKRRNKHLFSPHVYTQLF